MKRRLLSSLKFGLTLSFYTAIPHTIFDKLQPDTILSSHRKSFITIMASPIETKYLTAPQTEFLSLPREIRDEIYRLLVKGDHIAAGQLKRCKTKRTSLKLAVLRVSKLINEEAMDVFYSESTFHFNMYHENREGRESTALFAPPAAIDRMMNIDINIKMDDLQVYLDNDGSAALFDRYFMRRQIWNTAMNCITRAESRRNTIWIRCRSCSFDITTKMPRWMYTSLGLLSQFRTVVVVLSPPFLTRIREDGFALRTDKSAEHLETLESNTEAIKNCVQPSLGPAVTGHRQHPGHHQYATTLEFHPQEHLSKIPSAETDGFGLDADGFTLMEDGFILDLDGIKFEPDGWMNTEDTDSRIRLL